MGETCWGFLGPTLKSSSLNRLLARNTLSIQSMCQVKNLRSTGQPQNC